MHNTNTPIKTCKLENPVKMNQNQDQDQLMNDIVIPYYEPNTVAMEMYEHLYYDDIDPALTFSPVIPINHGYPLKYTRQYNQACDMAGGFDFDDDDEIVPMNLNNAFDSVDSNTIDFHRQDLIANISMCYPTLGLKAISEHVSRVYADTDITIESYVPGYRIGDYEYIVVETDYSIVLYGRKKYNDEYMALHMWFM